MASERPRLARWKQVLFALTPAVLLFGTAELIVRVALVARPQLATIPLPPESAGLLRPDDELFWSLAPSLDKRFLGVRVETNAEGLRSPEIAPKQAGEYRILSLGESSTFGTGVAGDETYTARLAVDLAESERASGGSRHFTAINAGVPAWSSFQSLRFLELRGLALEPDLLLFYHEVNDYLPSSLRDSSRNEIGLLKTDWQLYQARRAGGLARVARHSALVRFLGLLLARHRVEAFDRSDFANPLLEIGLPDIGLPPRLRRVEGDHREAAGLHEASLGRRVSNEERLRILSRLDAIAREHGIGLLLIHPSYRDSRPHECLLTDFARRHRVPMLDAYPVLHPDERQPGSLFRDSWHPTPEGHERLARALAEVIRADFLEPRPR